MPNTPQCSLDQQREAYIQRRFLAMPLAGAIAWFVIGICGLFMDAAQASLVLFICTGCIVYLGIFISRFTGENFLDKSRPKNPFDQLFLMTVLMALLVYAIAIPYYLQDITSLPLTVGILTGTMWVPLSWTIRHWVGLFHGIGRTVCILIAWYAFPDQRYVVIPFLIVALYLVTITITEKRWRALSKTSKG